jgi:hypothetical protein
MRSTTFLFITQYTSVQVLGEKRSRSRLSQHIVLGTTPRRDVATRRCFTRRTVAAPSLRERADRHLAGVRTALMPDKP